MNKEEALELILDYLDTLKIMHSEPEEDDENNIEILFVTEGKDSPGGFIESAITFSDNCIPVSYTHLTLPTNSRV